jgi:hypothetical protein
METRDAKEKGKQCEKGKGMIDVIFRLCGSISVSVLRLFVLIGTACADPFDGQRVASPPLPLLSHHVQSTPPHPCLALSHPTLPCPALPLFSSLLLFFLSSLHFSFFLSFFLSFLSFFFLFPSSIPYIFLY